MDESPFEALFSELIAYQQASLLKIGRRIVPRLTSDDILQPNDFPELENHPSFRYEEGLLAGIFTARAAMRVSFQEAFKKAPDE